MGHDVKSIIKQINEFMSSSINTSSDEYLAIWGNEEFFPEIEIKQSSDFKCGAFSNELEYLRGFINYWTLKDVKSLDDLIDLVLDKLFLLFLNMERIYNETDESIRTRIKCYIQRNGNISWGTKHCIKDVFLYYFESENLFVYENIPENDLVLNGSFEDGELDSWIKTQNGCTVGRTEAISFEGGSCAQFGIILPSSDSRYAQILQNIAVDSGKTYICNFFLREENHNIIGKDMMRVAVQRVLDSYYWNFSTRTWTSAYSYFPIKSSLEEEWKHFQINFTTNSSSFVNIIFKGGSFSQTGITNNFKLYLDKVELGEKGNYPSLKVIGTAESKAEMGFMNNWPGSTDPVTGLDYNNASFLDQDFILGQGLGNINSFYQKILDDIKPAGVKAVFEAITHDI